MNGAMGRKYMLRILLMLFLITACLLYLSVKSTGSQTELLRIANSAKLARMVISNESILNHVSQHPEVPSNQTTNEPRISTSKELQKDMKDDNKGTYADKVSGSRPVQVIIVTKMRSGSSFAGEIFNRNDDFVYYFEPLNEFKVNKIDTTAGFAGTSLQSVLKGILQCDFGHFKGFSWWNGRRPSQQCIQSLAYQPTSLCTVSNGKFKAATTTAISASQKATINDRTCKSRPNIAIKTVRIPDIGTLKDLVQDPALNVKVIHLVRDPRAVSNSRQDIHDPDNPTGACQNIEDNLKEYWINPPDWMRGHYMLLRYEDLAEQPQYVVDKVYEFLNMTAPSSVKKWLDENTTGDPRGILSKWSHTRNSAKTAHAWRSKLLIKFDKLLEAQSGCKNVMRLLGYKPVISKAQMRDMKYSTLKRFTYPLLPNIIT
ncbi:carbohydrate sulfotransferase 1-like [Amphiura filiformis]|uniref:carbohydrate sulfotransferase 1-like n=1 Tax=Amphiura filiformis TaxID=82378 RepID=UPI003B210FC7